MKPMITVRLHSVRATPQFVELCREYAQHYIRCAHEKIEAYRTEVVKQKGARAIVTDDQAVVETQREIARAQVVYDGLDLLRDHIECLYTFHYEQMARVYRQARIDLGLARVEDSVHLYHAVILTMAMLKAENSKFSEEKFITYINGGIK